MIPHEVTERGPEPWVTVPNVLSALRLLLSPVLPALAWADQGAGCVALMVALLLVDWLDGKLALWLGQRTTFGARLDSAADAVLYGCGFLALVLLRGEIMRAEAAWVCAALVSYAVSVLAGLWKFRRLPSYHNRLAKITWLLMLVAVVALFADWSVWPLRVALGAVVLTNLDALAITLVLPEWRANVASVFHALASRGP